MIRSKAVKNYKLKDWGRFEAVRVFIRDVRYAIRKPFWKLKLTWDWYHNVLHRDFDWDHSYLWRAMRYKMQRMLVALTDDAHLYQEPERIKALKECIRLLTRLTDKDHESYFEPAYKPHDKKWGRLKTWSEPTEDGKAYYWRSSRPKAKTKRQKEQERKEYLECHKKEDELRNADRKRLYELMYENELYWWD